MKKAKISAVLDQADETETSPITSAEVAIFYGNHKEITGAVPLPEGGLTDLQIVAM